MFRKTIDNDFPDFMDKIKKVDSQDLRLNNALDKNYTLAYEGDPNGPIINDPDWGTYSTAGFKYKTPGRSLFANLRYDF
jgi:hypothetical protein